MNDTILNLGSISVYGFGLLSVFAFLWGSFVFYKKAIESHFEEFHILDGVVMSAFWALIIGRLFYVFFHPDIFWNHLPRIFLFSNFPGIDRWGVYSGIFLGTYFTVRRAKGKIVDWFDLMVLGVSGGSAIFFAGISLMAFSWVYGICAILFAAAFSYFWQIEDKYRTFGWYRNNKTSAKSGLITGFSLSVWGFVYFLEKILLGKINWINILWATILFVGGLILVYIRSGRTVSEDLAIIFKHGRK